MTVARGAGTGTLLVWPPTRAAWAAVSGCPAGTAAQGVYRIRKWTDGFFSAMVIGCPGPPWPLTERSSLELSFKPPCTVTVDVRLYASIPEIVPRTTETALPLTAETHWGLLSAVSKGSRATVCSE